MNNLLQLKYAVEVENTGSISKAAENLYMNQPNLSKAIRELEDDLGVTIFDRTAKGMMPIEQGREFLRYARGILSQVAEMEALFRPAEDKKIRFDLCAPRSGYISRAFASLVSALGSDAAVRMSYRESGPMRAIKSVSNEVNRLGIIRYQSIYEPYYLETLAERSLEYEPVRSFTRAAVMHRQHPLAKKTALTENDLEPFLEILYGDWSVPALPVAEARNLARAYEDKKTISVYERASQMELLGSIPGSYALVAPEQQDYWDCFSLIQRPCKLPDNDYRDILIYRSGYRMTAEDHLFIEKLHEQVDHVSGA